MGDSTFATFQGLNTILESPRWPIAKKCQAVDGCLDLNRCEVAGGTLLSLCLVTDLLV